ncbi:MAG: hypothetical protein RSD68_05485, partial [Oscillospiraceae bacterium]
MTGKGKKFMNASAKNELIDTIQDKLGAHFGKKPNDASSTEIFGACAMLLREMVSRRRVLRDAHDTRQLHYL